MITFLFERRSSCGSEYQETFSTSFRIWYIKGTTFTKNMSACSLFHYMIFHRMLWYIILLNVIISYSMEGCDILFHIVVWYIIAYILMTYYSIEGYDALLHTPYDILLHIVQWHFSVVIKHNLLGRNNREEDGLEFFQRLKMQRSVFRRKETKVLT